MIKRLDKLVLSAFVGPFAVTFSVLIFIFLTQFLMNHFQDFIGKDLGIGVLAELFFYFSLNMVPSALPLAVLLSSLMTFGNLGEHFELTAIKSAGISLIRVIAPVFVLTLIISISMFFYSNHILPSVNLRAFSLMYDVKMKKMAFDIKPNIFYYGLPGYTVKITGKSKDDKIIRGVMIYDHNDGHGNTKVILADSGKMYTIYDGRYLVLELFNGENYSEMSEAGLARIAGKEFVHNTFDRSKLVFNLSSFDLSRTNLDLFKSNRMMRNFNELRHDVDSMNRDKKTALESYGLNLRSYFMYEFKPALLPADSAMQATVKAHLLRIDTSDMALKKQVISVAANQARNARGFTVGYNERLAGIGKDINIFTVEMTRKFTVAISCLVLFMIGAPLGAIIKKGGLGMPVLISIICFIIFYVISNTGEKWAKEGVVGVSYGMWAGNTVMLIAAFFFMVKSRNDSNKLDFDFSKIKRLFSKKAADSADSR